LAQGKRESGEEAFPQPGPARLRVKIQITADAKSEKTNVHGMEKRERCMSPRARQVGERSGVHL